MGLQCNRVIFYKFYGSWLSILITACAGEVVYYVSTDIDECNGDNDCHPEATCDNLAGSYSCTCNEGYKGTGSFCTGKF